MYKLPITFRCIAIAPCQMMAMKWYNAAIVCFGFILNVKAADLKCANGSAENPKLKRMKKITYLELEKKRNTTFKVIKNSQHVKKNNNQHYKS